jgi:16S rRNA (guanine1207-N2)-methyltransferase
MSDHYYTNQPNAKSDPDTWGATLKGHSFQFKTDSGVFSRERVDYGSKVLLDALDKKHFEDGELLDMGCGYGPIGLTLAREYPEATIHMVDVNERALSLAKENARENNIENVTIYSSYLYDNIEKTDFAGVITNPPIRAGKKVVHQILEEAYDHLKKDGKLIVVIQKKQGAPSAKKKMEEVFGNVTRLVQDKGYWILESIKEKGN